MLDFYRVISTTLNSGKLLALATSSFQAFLLISFAQIQTDLK